MGKPSSLFLIILITFNCYTSLVHSTEASLIHHNKQLISLLSSKTDYVIDDVLILLSGLLKTSQNELSTLEENWPATQAEKQASVVLYQGLVISQSDQCESLSEINSDLEEQIQETEDQIEEDSARIVANNERIDVLLAARCTQNRNYLTGLKKNKQALAIIQILRDAVNNFNPSLLEKKNLKIIANKFINFIQFTSKQNIIGLTQLLDLPDVQERTSK